MTRALTLLTLTLSMLTGCGDDGAAPPIDGGMPGDARGDSSAGPCHTAADCDDGEFCNGAEVCTEGACRPGSSIECDDGVPCTTDRCDEATAACVSRGPDADGDGHVIDSCGGDDCDDGNAMRYPGATEVCDPADLDEDCDPLTFGERDLDGDDHFDATCCNGTECGDDCDDMSSSVHPTATEACNLLDDDCDGTTDEDALVDLFVDADGDGHGDAAMPMRACADTAGLVPVGDDCDDLDPARHPGQAEFCDMKDNDCNGAVDDMTRDVPWYPDADGDGFGEVGSAAVLSCAPIAGRSLRDTDCDDASAAVHPGAVELCNSADDDCDGMADEGTAIDGFVDGDRDGFGDPSRPMRGCPGPDLARLGTDCDDADPARNPGAVEACDGLDNDCDGTVDDGATEVPWYLDGDGDGYGQEGGVPLMSCAPVAGRVLTDNDCDDGDAMVHPGAAEMCDGIDNDCSGAADYVIAPGDSEDDDGDAYVDGRCLPRGDDCDDDNPMIHPGAAEVCNGLDDDCDGMPDDGVAGTLYRDLDGDGVGSAASGTMPGCTPPAGYSRLDGDCDDSDAAVRPGAAEVCNMADDDCDGMTDEGAPRLMMCADRAATCGGLPDECGGVLECGTCAPGTTCGGGGVANTCGCMPRTCTAAGASCGMITDGCGAMVACGGVCPMGTSCGGGGVPNVCGARLCTAEGWCLQDPLPLQHDLVAVWARTGDDVWAVADAGRESRSGVISVVGAVLRRVNGAWTIATYTNGFVPRGIWGSSASDVWVAGDGGAIARWDGSAWAVVPSGTTGDLRAIWGSGPSDVWAVGETIVHWDGTSWTDVIGGGLALDDVWGSAPNRVFAVGEAGAVFRFDGSAWGPETLPPSVTWDLGAVWGASGTDVWAFRSDRTGIIHFDGATWTLVACDATCPNGVAGAGGTGASDLWAVGSNVASHWDGTRWTNERVPVRGDRGDLLAVSGSGSDLWFSGTAGTLAHRRSGIWDAELVDDNDQIADVWVSPDGGEAWAVGQSTSGTYRWHRTGGRWTRELIPISQPGVWGSAWNDVWIVGADPTDTDAVAQHWDGTTWTARAQGVGGQLEDAWGTGLNDVWAVGSGLMVHWDGTRWSRYPGFGGTAVWGAAADDVYAVGRESGSAIAHFDGSSWSNVDVSAVVPAGGWPFDATGVWGSSAADVYVVGNVAADPPEPVVLHWNGTAWSRVDIDAVGLGMNAGLNDVWGTGPTDVYVGASMFSFFTPVPTLLHFDGAAWVGTTAAPAVLSLWGSSATSILAGGRGGIARWNGSVWKREPRGPAAGSLETVWAASADDVWAGGYGRLLRRDASGWYEAPVGPTIFTRVGGIWGSAPNNVWVAGDSNTFARWNGTTYVTAVTSSDYTEDMHGTAANNVWAVGEGVVRYNGLTWASHTIAGATSPFRAVWANSTTDVWVIDGGSRIYRWNGTAWSMSPFTPPPAGEMHDLWGTGPSAMWAVGSSTRMHPTFGEIPVAYVARWNGTSWAAVGPSATDQFDFVALHGIWGRSATDYWVTGDFGVIFHRGATAWTAESTHGQSDLYAITGTASRAFIVGGGPYTSDSGSLHERDF